MAKNGHKSTTSKAASAASKVLRDGRTGSASKTAAGSALSQRPMSKPAHISSAQATKAVQSYLSGKKK
ncbi:hypothetical protein D9599_24510 [Roseomonas sp. KE2513]|nr:hypothetical protein [Roseomonas sp. KE2513]